MNISPRPVAGILGRLSIGVSNTSIRWIHRGRKQRKAPKIHLRGFKESHGEDIFVYHHTDNGMIVYSFDKELRRDRKVLLDQIPYTAKKLKPPVFRKDYWEPLCMIRFGSHKGEVGRNVFRMLRELRKLHETSWGWQAEDLIKMNKLQRGKTIHNQKRNAIADIAHLLRGGGRGNKMWAVKPQGKLLPAPTKTATTSTKDTASKSDAGKAEEALQGRLHKVTIWWANDSDLNWAREWSENVNHQLGLPKGLELDRWTTRVYHDDNRPKPPAEPKPQKSKSQQRRERAKATGERDKKDGPKKDKSKENKSETGNQPQPEKKSFLGHLFNWSS